MKPLPSLTKENFFDELKANYPTAWLAFDLWIDEYKKAVDWDSLFNDESLISVETQISKDSRRDVFGYSKAPKFHEIPFEMQIGILLKFVTENIPLLGKQFEAEIFSQSRLKELMEMVFELMEA